MRRVLISTKPFIFVLFPVGVTVRSAESLSSVIPLGTSTERTNSKRANHGRSRLFQDAVSSVSFWLRSFSVCGWRTRSLSSVSGPPTRWSCVREWLMRLLWAYEHDFAAISPFLYERIGTLCRHPCWSLWLEQRIAGWRSGRSEGYCKSLSAGHAPTDLLLLTQLTSIKRVGDLQAFSVSEACLVFGPVYSHVALRPRPGYVPKVPTTPFRDQVVNLQALPSEEADPALALLCPVRALRIYVTRTRSVRSSEQLFVCHGGQQKGKAVSKQRLAHWIVEAVALAYQSQGEPCPLGVRAHSTRSVASSHALAHGASLADIYRAAGWATPNTFARFYNLRVEPVSSHVLSKYWARRTGRCHACCAIPPHPGIRAPFSPPVQFPGRWTLVESSKHPRQSDWAEQSDARPSTGVSSPGSPVSPCTGLGVRMAWFPFG